MIEFGLLFGAGVLAFAVSVVLGRPLLSRTLKLRLATSSHGAVFGGVRNYLRFLDRALATFAGLIAIGTFVGVGVVRSHHELDPAASSLGLAGWLTASLLLGATSSVLATHLAAHAMTRTSPRVEESIRHGAADALRDGMQGAGAATLALGAVLLLSLTGLSLVAFSTAGGFTPASQAHAAHSMTSLVSAYALGAVLASIVTHTIGGVFIAAAPSLENVCVSVGVHLDVPVTRVADLFASLATVVVASMVLCVGATSVDGSSVGNPTVMALCPLIALAFAVLSSSVGVAVVRTDAVEPVGSAIDRGLVVTLTLGAASFVGLTQWMFGPQWWRFLLAAVAGLLGATVVLMTERFSAASTTQDDDTLRGWSVGFQRAAILPVVALAAALGGLVAGRSTGMTHGGSLGLALAALGMLTPAPFMLATAAFGTIVRRSLQRVLDTKERNANAERRLQSAVAGIARARGYSAVTTAMVAWAAVPALVQQIAPNKAAAFGDLQWGVVAASGLAGTLMVFGIASIGVRSVSAVIRSSQIPPVVDNTDEMMMQSPSLAGQTDSQRVATALQESVRQAIPVVLITLVAPVGVWTLLRVSLGTAPPSPLVEATSALILGASFASMTLSLAVDTIGYFRNSGIIESSSDATRDKPVDVSEKWAKNPRDGAAVVGDTLGSPLQSLTIPCIHALVKLLAAAALALAPLLF